jgi:hypothetical protein
VTTDSISEVVEVVKGVVGWAGTLSWAVDVSGGGVVESVVGVGVVEVVEVVGVVAAVVDVSEVFMGDEDEDDDDGVVLVVEVVEVVGSDEVVDVVEVGVVEVVDVVVEVVDVVDVVDVVGGFEVVVVVVVEEEEEELVEESVVDVFELAVVVARFATLYTLEAKLTSSSANASTACRSDVNTPSLKCGYTACNA